MIRNISTGLLLFLEHADQIALHGFYKPRTACYVGYTVAFVALNFKLTM